MRPPRPSLDRTLCLQGLGLFTDYGLVRSVKSLMKLTFPLRAQHLAAGFSVQSLSAIVYY